jgi:hypothetical protein
MRNPGFRCWDKFQKKYVFTDFHVIGEVTCFDMMEMVIRDTWKERSKLYQTTIESWNDFVVEEKVGFGTIVKDKNGKPLFEGDVVKEVDGEVEFYNVVVWNNDVCAFTLSDFVMDSTIISKDIKTYEIVGNVNENIDLLRLTIITGIRDVEGEFAKLMTEWGNELAETYCTKYEYYKKYLEYVNEIK